MLETHIKQAHDARRLYMVTCEHKCGSQTVTHFCNGETYLDPTEDFCVFVWAKGCNQAVAKVRRRWRNRVRHWPACGCQEWQQIHKPDWWASVTFNATLIAVACPLVGAQRVGEVGYSLLPLDVGFDLRVVQHLIAVPKECDTKGIAFMINNRPYAVWGQPWVIAELLLENGYKVYRDSRDERKIRVR